MELQELMELYRKTTQQEWRKNKAHDLWTEIRAGGGFTNHMVADCMKEEDADLTVALHNSFPAVVKRLQVAEKMAEIIESDSEEECPFVGILKIHCRDAGYSCNQCVRKNLRQAALAKLGKEDQDGH